ADTSHLVKGEILYRPFRRHEQAQPFTVVPAKIQQARAATVSQPYLVRRGSRDNPDAQPCRSFGGGTPAVDLRFAGRRPSGGSAAACVERRAATDVFRQAD